MKDEDPIIVRGTKQKWSEFKEDHPTWDFGNSITQDELFKLRGKFLNVWGRIGDRLCKKYDKDVIEIGRFLQKISRRKNAKILGKVRKM